MLFTVERFRDGLPNLLAESSNVVNYILNKNTGLATRNYSGERNYFVKKILRWKKDKDVREKYIYLGNLERFYFIFLNYHEVKLLSH